MMAEQSEKNSHSKEVNNFIFKTEEERILFIESVASVSAVARLMLTSEL